jgi:hypothetical protein
LGEVPWNESPSTGREFEAHGERHGDEPGKSPDIAEIEHEIEHTRLELSGTIDTIQERLAPEHLVQQAKLAARDAGTSFVEDTRAALVEATIGRAGQAVGKAEQIVHEMNYGMRDTGESLIDTIRHNPLPAAMAGIGIGWLLMRRGNGHGSSHSLSGSDRWRYEDDEYPMGLRHQHPVSDGGATDRIGQVPERAGEMVDRARETVSELASSATDVTTERAGRLANNVDGVRHRAVDQIQGFGTEAQRQAYRARTQLECLLDDAPLAVGAAALGLGAVIGLALPATSRERELMGEARETLMQRGAHFAQEAQQRLMHVAEEVQETATESMDGATHDLMASDPGSAPKSRSASRS